ncbi:MAG TPA: SDR family NAD(P)-dependent oxidoreductase [Candidatus Methylomirabilis sp.]|jgi:NAD(P)-dependent dehydrogenase (short-subunit alcohol dehydrogenase family)
MASIEHELVIIVTGAARGIGRGVVEAALAAGHTAVAVDVDEAALTQLADDMKGRPGRLETHTLDVTDRHAVKRIFDEVASRHGCIDVLVNNAGTNRPKPFIDVTEGDWDFLLSLNLKGTFLCTTAAVPHMLKRKRGKVINLASNIGQRGHAGMVPYAASKGGVIAFTKALGRELAPHGIQVNAVAPAATRTDRIMGYPEETREELRKLIPMGRLGEVSDVVATIMFLISPGGDFYCGQVLCPNGGDVML